MHTVESILRSRIEELTEKNAQEVACIEYMTAAVAKRTGEIVEISGLLKQGAEMGVFVVNNTAGDVAALSRSLSRGKGYSA